MPGWNPLSACRRIGSSRVTAWTGPSAACGPCRTFTGWTSRWKAERHGAYRVSTVQCLDEALVGKLANRPIGYGLIRFHRRNAAMKPSSAQHIDGILTGQRLDVAFSGFSV